MRHLAGHLARLSLLKGFFDFFRFRVCDFLLKQKDFSLAQKDNLYRYLDKLLAHHDALFKHLRARWEDLFGVKFEVLLYDLTSTR